MNARTFVPSPEQLAACERHTDSHGKPFYTCKSAHNEGTYTLRWHPGYANPSCNCQADPGACWHFGTAVYLERQYQEALRNGQVEASQRERSAVATYGDRAYESEGFSLLKVS